MDSADVIEFRKQMTSLADLIASELPSKRNFSGKTEKVEDVMDGLEQMSRKLKRMSLGSAVKASVGMP
jgi:hypothetical protein